MTCSPVITGLGLATPLGNTLPATWQSLCAGGFISDHARVPDFDIGTEPRVNAIARRVAREAVRNARWTPTQTRNAALVVGTSKGPVDAWLASIGSERKLHDQDDRQSLPAFGLSETAAAVGEDIGVNGPRLTLCAACASGLHALIRAAMMIRSGEVSRALVIASESSLHPLFIASFTRLGVIAPPGLGCRPFDQLRGGFVIGEAAAAVCLEAADAAPAGRSNRLAIENFALGADPAHLTGGDPSGIPLRDLLRRVIDRRPLDLIHAHGTGTLAHDPIELAAIESASPSGSDDRPSLYSSKAALGHSLGAAGLVAVAINCMSHTQGHIPPNVRTANPLPASAVCIDQRSRQRTVDRSLALAAGFGGALAAVSLVSSE